MPESLFVRLGVFLFFRFRGSDFWSIFRLFFSEGSFGLSYIAQGSFIRVLIVFL